MDRPGQLIVLGVYLAVASAVSAVVGLAARREAEAVRARAEAQALMTLAGAALAEQQTLPEVLEQIRRTGSASARLRCSRTSTAAGSEVGGVQGDGDRTTQEGGTESSSTR